MELWISFYHLSKKNRLARSRDKQPQQLGSQAEEYNLRGWERYITEMYITVIDTSIIVADCPYLAKMVDIF